MGRLENLIDFFRRLEGAKDIIDDIQKDVREAIAEFKDAIKELNDTRKELRDVREDFRRLKEELKKK